MKEEILQEIAKRIQSIENDRRTNRGGYIHEAMQHGRLKELEDLTNWIEQKYSIK